MERLLVGAGVALTVAGAVATVKVMNEREKEATERKALEAEERRLARERECSSHMDRMNLGKKAFERFGALNGKIHRAQWKAKMGLISHVAEKIHQMLEEDHDHPLLSLPVVGRNNSVSQVVLSILYLLGDPELYREHILGVFDFELTGFVDPDEAMQFGFPVRRLNPSTADAVVAALETVAKPSLTSPALGNVDVWKIPATVLRSISAVGTLPTPRAISFEEDKLRLDVETRAVLAKLCEHLGICFVDSSRQGGKGLYARYATRTSASVTYGGKSPGPNAVRLGGIWFANFNILKGYKQAIEDDGGGRFRVTERVCSEHVITAKADNIAEFMGRMYAALEVQVVLQRVRGDELAGAGFPICQGLSGEFLMCGPDSDVVSQWHKLKDKQSMDILPFLVAKDKQGLEDGTAAGYFEEIFAQVAEGVPGEGRAEQAHQVATHIVRLAKLLYVEKQSNSKGHTPVDLVPHCNVRSEAGGSVSEAGDSGSLKLQLKLQQKARASQAAQNIVPPPWFTTTLLTTTVLFILVSTYYTYRSIHAFAGHWVAVLFALCLLVLGVRAAWRDFALARRVLWVWSGAGVSEAGTEIAKVREDIFKVMSEWARELAVKHMSRCVEAGVATVEEAEAVLLEVLLVERERGCDKQDCSVPGGTELAEAFLRLRCLKGGCSRGGFRMYGPLGKLLIGADAFCDEHYGPYTAPGYWASGGGAGVAYHQDWDGAQANRNAGPRSDQPSVRDELKRLGWAFHLKLDRLMMCPSSAGATPGGGANAFLDKLARERLSLQQREAEREHRERREALRMQELKEQQRREAREEEKRVLKKRQTEEEEEKRVLMKRQKEEEQERKKAMQREADEARRAAAAKKEEERQAVLQQERAKNKREAEERAMAEKERRKQEKKEQEQKEKERREQKERERKEQKERAAKEQQAREQRAKREREEQERREKELAELQRREKELQEKREQDARREMQSQALKRVDEDWERALRVARDLEMEKHEREREQRSAAAAGGAGHVDQDTPMDDFDDEVLDFMFGGGIVPKHLEESEECAMCLSGPKEWVFVPCGHKAVCSKCVESNYQSLTQQCIICRTALRDPFILPARQTDFGGILSAGKVYH